jgi:hypothetical protein
MISPGKMPGSRGTIAVFAAGSPGFLRFRSRPEPWLFVLNSAAEHQILVEILAGWAYPPTAPAQRHPTSLGSPMRPGARSAIASSRSTVTRLTPARSWPLTAARPIAPSPTQRTGGETTVIPPPNPRRTSLPWASPPKGRARSRHSPTPNARGDARGWQGRWWSILHGKAMMASCRIGSRPSDSASRSPTQVQSLDAEHPQLPRSELGKVRQFGQDGHPGLAARAEAERFVASAPDSKLT